MEEVARTLKSAVSLVVLLITSKILYDLLKESYQNRSLQHWGLIGLFAAIASTVLMVVAVTYALETPLWLHAWHIINLVLFGVGLYHMLTELGEENGD